MVDFEFLKNFIQEKCFELTDQQNIDPRESWHYGARINLEPQVIMEGITESLIELNTVSVFFRTKLNIKKDLCYKISKLSNKMFP